MSYITTETVIAFILGVILSAMVKQLTHRVTSKAV